VTSTNENSVYLDYCIFSKQYALHNEELAFIFIHWFTPVQPERYLFAV